MTVVHLGQCSHMSSENVDGAIHRHIQIDRIHLNLSRSDPLGRRQIRIGRRADILHVASCFDRRLQLTCKINWVHHRKHLSRPADGIRDRQQMRDRNALERVVFAAQHLCQQRERHIQHDPLFIPPFTS